MKLSTRASKVSNFASLITHFECYSKIEIERKHGSCENNLSREYRTVFFCRRMLLYRPEPLRLFFFVFFARSRPLDGDNAMLILGLKKKGQNCMSWTFKNSQRCTFSSSLTISKWFSGTLRKQVRFLKKHPMCQRSFFLINTLGQRSNCSCVYRPVRTGSTSVRLFVVLLCKKSLKKVRCDWSMFPVMSVLIGYNFYPGVLCRGLACQNVT